MITRPFQAAQPIAEALRQRGYEPVIDPVLQVEPIAYTMPDSLFSMALITSSNAIPALAGLAPHLPILTVGAATATQAQEAGFDARCIGQTVEEAALSLVEMPGPILYLSGEQVAHDLGATIGSIVRVPVYAATAIPLEKTTIDLLSSRQIDWILVFSRRSAEALAMTVADMDSQGWIGDTGIVCLSARTAEPLKTLPWRTVQIAAEPTSAALLNCLPGIDA